MNIGIGEKAQDTIMIEKTFGTLLYANQTICMNISNISTRTKSPPRLSKPKRTIPHMQTFAEKKPAWPLWKKPPEIVQKTPI